MDLGERGGMCVGGWEGGESAVGMYSMREEVFKKEIVGLNLMFMIKGEVGKGAYSQDC